MKILITGSNGFVGKELINELKKQTHTIFEFDISQGQNILDREQVKKALNGIDVVIHLAAIIDTTNKDLWKINVEGTKNLIEESVANKISKFILLSSTGVYGLQKGTLNENSETHPETIYDKSKLEAEELVLTHQEEINVNILRSAMIFGPNNYWKNMFKILAKNYPLPCLGKNIFQIIYIKELARALIKVMEKGESGEIYLVSGKEQWTLKEFCKKTKKLMNKKEQMFSIPETLAIIIGKIFKIKILTKENIHHLKKSRKYSLEKIYSIGYKQKYTLNEAILKTLNELKEENK